MAATIQAELWEAYIPTDHASPIHLQVGSIIRAGLTARFSDRHVGAKIEPKPLLLRQVRGPCYQAQGLICSATDSENEDTSPSRILIVDCGIPVLVGDTQIKDDCPGMYLSGEVWLNWNLFSEATTIDLPSFKHLCNFRWRVKSISRDVRVRGDKYRTVNVNTATIIRKRNIFKARSYLVECERVTADVESEG